MYIFHPRWQFFFRIDLVGRDKHVIFMEWNFWSKRENYPYGQPCLGTDIRSSVVPE
jgi:hypothetical protein